MAVLLTGTTIAGNIALHAGNVSTYALPIGGGTLTGQLNLHAGSYEGSIVFGSQTVWRTGIRQHDDGDAELRIWAKNADGMIFIATGYDGEPASISRPTDGLAIQGNKLGIGDFSTADPLYKLHVKGDIYANGGWVRVSGSEGLYFESYAGGWRMTDSTWIRAYNDKNIYTGGSIEAGGSVRADSGILDSNRRFVIPGGASTVNHPSGTGGAIRINLPTATYGVNTMMSMTVQVYEYSTGQSFTIRCGGYNYFNHDWYNVFAYLLNDSGKGADVPVYFGNDGTRDVIWIGEPGWSWSYPNVFVTDFQAGHSQYESWKTGWSISFDTAARTNVSASRTAYRQIDTGTIGSQSVSYATTSGSTTGNAATATTLATARTLTIGNTGKTFNGGANVSWTLAEIGAQAAGSYAAASHTHPDATTSVAGFMSTADKTKLDGIAASANNYSLPLATASVRGGVKIGYTASGQNYPVQLSSEQMYVNVPWTDTNTTYSAGTGLTLSGTTFSVTAGTYADASHTHGISGITDSTRWWNNFGDNHSTRTAFDATTPSYGFGWRFVQGATNGPGVNGAGQYYSLYTGLGNDYAATGAGSYGMQLAIPRDVTTPYLAVRYNENNSLKAWQKISAGYADSAGAVAWTNVSSRPTALSQFTNDLGNYGGWITSSGSISGSSGSVTGLTLTSSANGINPDSVTQNQIGYDTSVSLFSQSDGGLYSSAYSSSWIHQIHGDFRTGQIAIRGKNNGTWQAWRTVLDSSNFSTWAAAASHTHTPSQVGLGNVSNTAQVTTTYNSSLNSDSRNSRGVTRLYRRDDDSDFSVQTNWTGSHWHIRGYNGDTFHAEARVGYADSAGSASSVAWTNVSSRPTTLSGFTNDVVARTSLSAAGDFQFGGQDISQNSFTLSAATTDTDQFGRFYYSGTSGSFWSRYLPVDKSGKYRMRIRWKASASSSTYIAVILLDTNGNNINGAGTYWAYPWSGSGAPTSWTTSEYWYDGSSFPSNAAYVAFGISHTNYGGGSATYYVSQLEIERYNHQINGNVILHAGNYNSYSPTLTGTGASGSWGINITGSSASTTGNAATATALQNGRTLTVGATGKTFDGTGNVAWSLAEIGAQAAGSYAAASHTHSISDVINLASALNSKLGTSDKAADSELIDGIDSSRIIYGDGARGSTYVASMNDPNQKSGFFFKDSPTGQPFGDWWNWLTVAGNSWQSSNNYSFQISHAFHSDDAYIRRMTNGTAFSWRTLITSGNISSQSVNFATSAGSATSSTTATTANRLERYGVIYGNNWNDYYLNNRFIVASAHNATGTNKPDGAYNYGSTLSYYNSGEDHYQIYLPENSVNSNGKDRKMYYRSGWNGSWGGWRSVVDVYNSVCYIDAAVTATGDITAFSDGRVKENVETLEGALDKTLKLRGVSYNRTDIEDKSTKIGVIAQEILEVVPEVVSQDENGMYAVSYGNITALLIEAIKEQQKQIDELKEIINGLTK